MESLDPRINRLNRSENLAEKEQLDQLETYEVFLQLKEGKPFQHVGVVHASDEEMAFVFAKEQFSRRLTCTGLWVVRTANVYISPVTENEDNIYNHFEQTEKGNTCYEVFHLLKRGKQHIHAGSVQAGSLSGAFAAAALAFGDTMAYNIWVTECDYLMKSAESDVDIWSTLPDKKFRDALAYKAGDKLKEFLEKKRS